MDRRIPKPAFGLIRNASVRESCAPDGLQASGGSAIRPRAALLLWRSEHLTADGFVEKQDSGHVRLLLIADSVSGV
jgi:hypothetical protein